MEKRKNKTRLARAAMTLLVMLFCFTGARAQQTLPYSYGFENNNLATDGWIANVTSTSSGINGAAACSGSYGFQFYYSERNASLISPVLTGGDKGIDVSFWYKEYSASYGDEQFYVGYTTDVNVTDPDDFTYGDIITASTSWQQYENSFPAGTKRIAIKYVYNDAFYLYLDDFSFEAISSCPKPKNLEVTLGDGTATATWTSDATSFNIDINGTVTNNVTSPYTFNVELATTYTVKVQASCGEGETSEWSNPFSFTTDLCLPEDMCEITFELTDSWGDGWNGAAIQVVDAVTNDVIATMAADSHGGGNVSSTDIKKLKLCNGREILFQWITGSYDEECSYVVKDINEEVIFEGSDEMSGPVTHTVNCTLTICRKPTNLAETNITTNSATLSWEGYSDSYVLQLRPWTPAGEDVLPTGTMTTYTFDLSNYSGRGAVVIRHYDVTNMFRLIVDDIVVKNANGETVYSQDFETSGGSMPSEFSTIDLDGDGYNWEVVDNNQSYVNGTYGLSSASWTSTAGALTPDNWIILSDIELGGSISFAACGQDASFAAENFCVYVSADEDMLEIPVGTTSYTAEDLTPNTPYSWQVAGVCGEEEQSNFASGSIFKTKDDALVFATEGNWDVLNNWTDAEGNAVTALPTIDNRVRIDANVTIPSGVIAYTKKANLNGGTITIEDGGQLKQNSTVDVILEKEINAAHYYLIATPLTTTEIASQQEGWAYVNVLTGNYDLYAFDSTADLEWINNESSSNHSEFTSGSNENVLSNQRGYLYANESETTLKYVGSTAWSSYQSVVTADVDATSTDVFNGWKLIGNPFSCNGYVSYSGDATFYKMNEAGDGFEAFEGGVELAPAEGAFMKVSASGTITFSSEAPEGFNSTSTSAAGLLPILPSHGEEDNQDANLSEEIVNITFAKEGFATYYNGEYDVVLTAGMKAHVVTDGSTSLTYAGLADGDTDENVVPAGTAVLLQVEATESNQTLPVYLATPSAAAYTGTNLLYGSDVAATTTGGAKYYKLTYSNNDDNFGWYWGAADGGAFTSPAHKAWLALPASARSFLGLPDWQDATGIAPVGIDFENGEWYTLQGLKIGKKPTSAGVYIHNGRKVVVK